MPTKKKGGKKKQPPKKENGSAGVGNNSANENLIDPVDTAGKTIAGKGGAIPCAKQ